MFPANVDVDKRERLKSIGVSFTTQWRTMKLWDRMLLPALHHYNALNGHCNVPDDFVIPSACGEQPAENPWPAALREIWLGPSRGRCDSATISLR